MIGFIRRVPVGERLIQQQQLRRGRRTSWPDVFDCKLGLERVCKMTAAIGVSIHSALLFFFMRNASVSVSNNAIVGVRRRLHRHEMLLSQYLGNCRVSNFEIWQKGSSR